ncbi:MAG: hypothetical protein R6V07_19320, partial [Armatimonadota bacterium]
RGHCTDWIAWLAMARPDVAMKVTHDGTVLLACPGRGDLRSVVGEIHGSNVARQMLPVDMDTGAVRIHGLVSRPELSRTTRRNQVFIVNERYVRSTSLGHALREAYGILLPSGRHPLCTLHLEVPSELVDPNVHPTKIEVRFRNQQEMHNLTQQAVEEALEEAGMRPGRRADRSPGMPADCAGRWKGPGFEQQARARRLRVNPFADSVDERDDGLEVHGDEPATEAAFERGDGTPEDAFVPEDRLEALGQVAATYIACRAGGDLLLVDQHRAAERIIADKIAQTEGKVQRQMLVLPMTLELTGAELAAVEEHRGQLDELGFQLEPFGGSDYICRSVPASLVDGNAEDALRAIIEELAQWGSTDVDDAREKLVATVACHAAIKSGQALTDREVHELIEALNASATPAICPHGDPTIITIRREELDRKFGRG